jgi:hypothetical protein
MATSKKKEKVEQDEFDLDKKVLIRNLTTWNTGFSRIETIGDVSLVPKGSVKIARSELIAQSQNGNKSFNGTDGRGSHADIYIDDAPTRVELGFESEDGKLKQLVFSDELVEQTFAISNFEKFKKVFDEVFVTETEKEAVVEAIGRLGINDYSKIRFTEEHTGLKIQ